jgi:subtilisin family serine protease
LKKALLFTLTIFLFLCACAQEVTFPKIDRYPPASDWRRGKLTELPTYDPLSEDPWKVDLRAYDLSFLDLSGSFNDLQFADFDDETIWPPNDKMPPEFDWQEILEIGKNPGLGIRELHDKGITGEGVGIAIIDQPLLVEHQEYAGQLKLYEEMHKVTGSASMHGPAVASIAVGDTVGVAPEADLYYIATLLCYDRREETADFSCLAESVYRIMEINKNLPEDRKIRVLSMSIGWGPESKGYEEIKAAAAQARDEGMLVVCSSIESVHGFKFHGLGREPMSDPEDSNSYQPGSWWAQEYYDGDALFTNRLLVPMDSRTTASPHNLDEYVFYREGGWSWSIPYIAGLYALSAQVDPTITPAEFWALALSTGQTVTIEQDGKVYLLGPIVDPVSLIDALENK